MWAWISWITPRIFFVGLPIGALLLAVRSYGCKTLHIEYEAMSLKFPQLPELFFLVVYPTIHPILPLFHCSPSISIIIIYMMKLTYGMPFLASLSLYMCVCVCVCKGHHIIIKKMKCKRKMEVRIIFKFLC